MTYKAVLFDFDGTLADTGEGVFASVQNVVALHGREPLSNEVLRSFIGPPIKMSFIRVYGLPEEEADQWNKEYRVFYTERHLLKAFAYEGMLETLKTLKERGIKMAVATYKPQEYAEKVFAHLGFGESIPLVFGADMAGKLTKADIIMRAVDALGAPLEETLMIGDSKYDAIGAKQAGVPFLGVSYGYGFSCRADVDEYSNVGCVESPLGILRYF